MSDAGAGQIPEAELTIRRAHPDDLGDVVLIEQESFSAPWPVWSLQQELKRSDAVYLVVEADEVFSGYAGMWLVVDEGHIGTIAVTSAMRGHGLGEALMLALLELGDRECLERIFLEYRVSNCPAAALYAKLGFEQTRIRKRYYADNNEDAVEVILPDLQSPARRAHLEELRRLWEVRHARRLPPAP
jgi:ribosomal-protein-alanine N-acetyltransferase